MSLSLKEKYYLICLPIRTLLFILILLTPEKFMKFWMLAGIILFLVVGYRYMTYDAKQLGGFGQPVRWQNNRLFHLTVIGMFIIAVYNKNYKVAKLLPLFDLSSFLFYTPTLSI